MEGAPSLEPVHLERPAVPEERWTWQVVLASLLMGATGAFAAAVVRLGFRGLQWVLTGSSADPPMAAVHLTPWRRALTPVLGAVLASAVLVLRQRRAHRLGREPRPYVEYVEAVRHGRGRIPLMPNCWRTLSAAFSVASGAAVGREGSMIQFAAAIASLGGRWRPLLERRSAAQQSFLVACGVAGGVTTAYNAPVAAVFFAAEIVLGGLSLLQLPLLALASAAGWLVSGALLGTERLYPAHAAVAPGWTLWLLPVLACLAGLAGPVYQWLLASLRGARRLPLALLCSGAVVGVLSVFEPRVWGNGDVGLRAALGSSGLGTGSPAAALARVLALRLAATFACVWTGTVGGVFTPTLFAGGAAGALLAFLPPAHDPTLWAIAGMCCFMAAVTHAPLMSACIAVELTGDWQLLPVLLPLACLSFGVAHRLSPRAMYAIASQSPAHESAMPSPRPQTVQ